MPAAAFTALDADVQAHGRGAAILAVKAGCPQQLLGLLLAGLAPQCHRLTTGRRLHQPVPVAVAPPPAPAATETVEGRRPPPGAVATAHHLKPQQGRAAARLVLCSAQVAAQQGQQLPSIGAQQHDGGIVALVLQQWGHHADEGPAGQRPDEQLQRWPVLLQQGAGAIGMAEPFGMVRCGEVGRHDHRVEGLHRQEGFELAQPPGGEADPEPHQLTSSSGLGPPVPVLPVPGPGPSAAS